jgi:hypothetical protein
MAIPKRFARKKNELEYKMKKEKVSQIAEVEQKGWYRALKIMKSRTGHYSNNDDVNAKWTSDKNGQVQGSPITTSQIYNPPHAHHHQHLKCTIHHMHTTNNTSVGVFDSLGSDRWPPQRCRTAVYF